MPTLQELLERSIGFVDRTKQLNLLEQKNLIPTRYLQVLFYVK
ncbi:hypothetical protein [[Phormidium ambiguum] IAM M-71]|nr:hypothetical protein [Phormidium ambiguum]